MSNHTPNTTPFTASKHQLYQQLLGSSGSYDIFKTRSAVRILADKNGGQFCSQDCLPYSVRIVRVFGHAVRTHQCTCNIPSKDESYPTPTLGRMRGGVPGRHPHLLARHAITRRAPTTRLRSSSTRTLQRQTIQERLRSREGPIPRTYRKRSRSSRRPQENQRRAYVEDTRELVEQLKQTLTSAPVLILPDPERDYVIEANASDQAVGAVLMQDQGNGLQPIAYLSKKLHGAELNYPIHDKEALAIIIAFKTWRCYLKGRKTTVYTDHCSLKYLKTQPSLSRRQVRWTDFLERHFHYDIVYKPGHKNKADALSRPAHVAAIQVEGMNPLLKGLFIQGYTIDPEIPLAEKGHLLQWDNDIAYRKGSMKIWVPNYPPLRQLLLEEYHDVLYAGHFGSNKTLTGIAKHYYWPHMADDVQKFVTSCTTCQPVKSSKQKKAGLLQPLPVPEQPWQVVSLDFITRLLTTTSGHDAILIVIDKFSKMGHFIPTHTTARTEETAQLFFTSKFWKELMSLLGTKLAMSSAYHPQTDGQTECLNQIVEQLLRAACKDDISKWDLHLPVLEFAYNNATHAATGQMPFFLCYGCHPLTPQQPTIPATMHNAFHVQLLKPYRDPNTVFSGRQLPPPPPVLVHDEPEYEVESVLAHHHRRNGIVELLIRWKGYDPSEDSWVSESEMDHARRPLRDYLVKQE
ncbi:hypothetical protein CLOP_g16428 [Closterium sp. NIES-67]|nr:hypothetical protein CLOP_g16428 [Closterium sp. NIES-67]